MDLRPRNKTQSSIIDHFSSWEAGTREANTKCNMAAEDQCEVEQSCAILQEIKRGNEALSQKFDVKTAEINQAISGLKTVIDGLVCSRITEAEERISTVEDKLTELDSRVLRLIKEKDFLIDKVDQLENQSRRNNIRIVNLQEGQIQYGSSQTGSHRCWGESTFPSP